MGGGYDILEITVSLLNQHIMGIFPINNILTMLLITMGISLTENIRSWPACTMATSQIDNVPSLLSTHYEYTPDRRYPSIGQHPCLVSMYYGNISA